MDHEYLCIWINIWRASDAPRQTSARGYEAPNRRGIHQRTKLTSLRFFFKYCMKKNTVHKMFVLFLCTWSLFMMVVKIDHSSPWMPSCSCLLLVTKPNLAKVWPVQGRDIKKRFTNAACVSPYFTFYHLFVWYLYAFDHVLNGFASQTW